MSDENRAAELREAERVVNQTLRGMGRSCETIEELSEKYVEVDRAQLGRLIRDALRGGAVLADGLDADEPVPWVELSGTTERAIASAEAGEVGLSIDWSRVADPPVVVEGGE